MSERLDWPRYSRGSWIVAILLLIVLIALWLAERGPGGAALCCGTPAEPSAPPVAAPPAVSPPAAAPAAAASQPGRFGLHWQGGRVVLEGSVPDQATKNRLLKSAAAAYGDANVVDRLSIDAASGVSACSEKADGLFAALKRAFSIGLACEGEQIVLTGTAISDADKAARESWARDFFGSGAQIVNRIDVVEPAAPVAKAADVKCSDRITAAVTFATGSAEIDGDGRALLDAIVPCLAAGEYEISGHTDNTGTPEINNPLSKTRAEAVRTYLVGKGVAGDRLVAVGYGADNPIADNATEQGRAKNRRIEFNKR